MKGREPGLHAPSAPGDMATPKDLWLRDQARTRGSRGCMFTCFARCFIGVSETPLDRTARDEWPKTAVYFARVRTAVWPSTCARRRLWDVKARRVLAYMPFGNPVMSGARRVLSCSRGEHSARRRWSAEVGAGCGWSDF